MRIMKSLKFGKFLTLRNSKGISKKGQAAMEFLMTYGWAILVVLVAIGALAYFGVLSPEKFLPETCIIGPGFSCDDFRIIGSTGVADLIIRNGGKDALYNTKMVILKDGVGETATTSVDCSPTTVPIGTATTCTITDLVRLGGTAGTRFKGSITLTYDAGSGGLTHSKTGDLVIKFE